MRTIKTFTINCDQKIEIQVPDLEEKCNYFYEPTEDLHRFDEITIVYRDKENEYFLRKDALQYLMSELYKAIKLLLKKELLIPNQLKGYVTLQIVQDELHSRKIEEDIENKSTSILSLSNITFDNTKDIYTVMYNINNTYYIEISPKYEWLFGPLVEEDDEDIDEEPEGFYSFEEYEKNYKPLVVAELAKETLLDWKKKCEGIFDQVGIKYKK